MVAIVAMKSRSVPISGALAWSLKSLSTCKWGASNAISKINPVSSGRKTVGQLVDGTPTESETRPTLPMRHTDTQTQWTEGRVHGKGDGILIEYCDSPNLSLELWLLHYPETW